MHVSDRTAAAQDGSLPRWRAVSPAGRPSMSAGRDQAADAPLPAALETILLDAGNTLITLDAALIAREFARRDRPVDPATFGRAEAAARPATSRYVADSPGQSDVGPFTYYLARIAERLQPLAGLPAAEREALCADVAASLKRPGGDHQLWSIVMPGVADALAALDAAGFRLVVVSNSDGSVARALGELGLARYLDGVLDSAVVGYEKPDPRFFLHALEVAGARAETTLHVGDMYFQDIVGARAAGIDSVLLDPHGDWADMDCRRRRSLAEVAAELTGGARRRQ